MNLIVVVKDDVVVQFRIGFVSLDPFSLQIVMLSLHIGRSFCQELRRGQAEQELLVESKTI